MAEHGHRPDAPAFQQLGQRIGHGEHGGLRQLRVAQASPRFGKIVGAGEQWLQVHALREQDLIAALERYAECRLCPSEPPRDAWGLGALAREEEDDFRRGWVWRRRARSGRVGQGVQGLQRVVSTSDDQHASEGVMTAAGPEREGYVVQGDVRTVRHMFRQPAGHPRDGFGRSAREGQEYGPCGRGNAG